MLVSQTSVRYYALPDSLLQPSDLHAIEAVAAPRNESARSFRFVIRLLHRPNDQAVAFGPTLTTPTVTTLSSAPYLRPRVQLPSQLPYDAAVYADYSQNGNSLEVMASGVYFGGTPQSWTLDVPDLTTAGYELAWSLQGAAPLDWEVGAVGGNFLVFSGATVVDGAQVVGAGTASSASALRMSPRAAYMTPAWRP
jgi:hypothetical protein